MGNRTYKFFQEKPLYPFGYGLSYTSFAYSNMKADKEVFAPGENLTVTVTVKNTGLMDGEEVVQCYVRDEEASVRVPVHKLCQTARVCLRAGEEKEVSLTISSDQFCVINEDGEHIWEPGRFFIFAGGSQPDDYSVTLTGSAPSRVAVSMK